MKKFVLLVLTLLISNSVFAYEYTFPFLNEIKESQSLIYNIETKEWKRIPVDFSKNSLSSKELVFTKYWSKGSGGYSEYELNSTEENFFVTSTYEFLDGTSLIAYNAHLLKFYQMDFINEKIVLKELTCEQVQKYFPNVELVKISDFKHNSITLKKPWFQSKTFMLITIQKQTFININSKT